MTQVKVNLKEYPTFWEQLKVAQHQAARINATTAEQLIEKVFGFIVNVHPRDRLGVVSMDAATFTWFELKWN